MENIMIFYEDFYKNYKPDSRTYEDFMNTQYAPLVSADREALLKLVMDKEYGWLKDTCYKTEVECVKEEKWLSGNIIRKELKLKVVFEDETAEIPFVAFIPVKKEKVPAFLYISFESGFPNKYSPVEEICDSGFAFVSFGYKDVADDKDDGFISCLERHFIGKREEKTAGKICLWSTVAIMIMDYMQTVDEIDKENIAVVGHSRLGKTALLTAATDERFAFAYSNDAGCSGDALARGTNGEEIKDICKNFPYWFCENYKKYANNEQNMPFDQHYLIATIAPRYVHLGSASEDWWADPVSQYLSCVAAGDAFKNGFCYEEKMPEINDEFFEGDVGFHMRKGLHYYSREDWLKSIKFVKMKTQV